jgi:polyisoprenoid-binding protein YceI
MLILACGTVASAAEFHVDKDKKNQVKFISDAPVEKIVGVTDQLDGYLFWSGDDTLDSSELYFEVDLNSIDTGIGLRNRHMRDNYLETDKHPYAKYTARAVDIKKAADRDGFEVRTRGKFDLHGIEREIEVAGTVSPVSDGFLIECVFEVKLTDYDITIPQLMFLKIDEIIALELRFHVVEVKQE